MKKIQLALSIIVGAYAIPALAAGSSVQLYGLIDLGLSHFTNGSTSMTKMSTGGESGSRIGVKGSEDLGGGLKAFFQVETGFCANGTLDKSGYCSGGEFMGRTSMVGLKGGFGTVQMGRIYSEAFHDEVAVDPFHYGTMGDISNIGLAGTYSTVPPRFNQAVEYILPSMHGLSAAAQYAFGDGKGYTADEASTAGYDLHVGYENGPADVRFNYLRVNDSGGFATSKHAMLTGAYDFGVAKVSAMYAQNHPDTGHGDERKVVLLGVTVPVGKGDVLASYTKLKDQTKDNHGATKIAVGYTYAFSRTINLYASYAHISNDSDVFYAVDDSSNNNDLSSASHGSSSSGVDLGLRYKF